MSKDTSPSPSTEETTFFNKTPNRSVKKTILLILLLLSSGHIFIELVLLFADYLDGKLSANVVTKPKTLLTLLTTYILFRMGQLGATLGDLPLTMFVLAWINLNVDVLLVARFAWYLFISGFSLTPLFLSRLLMLAVEGAIPLLTWYALKDMRKQRVEREIMAGNYGGLGRSASTTSLV